MVVSDSYRHYMVVALNAVSVVGTVIILVLIVRLNIKTDMDLHANHESSNRQLQEIKQQEAQQAKAQQQQAAAQKEGAAELKCVLELFGANRQAVVTGTQIDACIGVSAVTSSATPGAPSSTVQHPKTASAATTKPTAPTTGAVSSQQTSTDQTKPVTTSSPPPAAPKFSVFELLHKATDALIDFEP